MTRLSRESIERQRQRNRLVLPNGRRTPEERAEIEQKLAALEEAL